MNLLIDGGSHQTFEKHLKPILQRIPSNGKLDLMVLSHIDNDHIIGPLDLLSEIKTQRDNGIKELIKITGIWHNSFNDLLELQTMKLLVITLPSQSSIETRVSFLK